MKYNKLKLIELIEKDKHSYAEIGLKVSLHANMVGKIALENKSIPESVIRKLTDHKSDRMLRKYVRKPSQELINSVVKQISE